MAQQISWMSLEPGVAIRTTDGDELGKVHEVIADRQQDIFSGVTFRDGLLGHERFVPAEVIDELTTDEVVLAIPAAETESRIKRYED